MKEEGGINKMCEIAKKYFADGQKSGEDKVRFEIFFALVTEDGLSIADALSKARVPEEDQSRYVEMYNERIAQQD